MIKIFEAFAGIGAQRMALDILGIDYESVAISEIDANAERCYNLLHGETKNLGDIRKIKDEDIPAHDLFTYSFPCQDISTAGKQAGFDRGSDTRSSLLWECERIIRHSKPTYLLLENVKNIIGKKNEDNFFKWLDILADMGYTSYYKVLNAKDFGVPQNRERMFVVSILSNRQDFVFEEPNTNMTSLVDVSDFNTEDNITSRFYDRYKENNTDKSMEDFKQYLAELPVTGNLIKKKRLGLYNFNETDTLATLDGIAPTLTATGINNGNKKFYYNGELYRPSVKMAWRLMGMDTELLPRLDGVPKNIIYKCIGNSIAVPVLVSIFKSLLTKQR